MPDRVVHGAPRHSLRIFNHWLIAGRYPGVMSKVRVLVIDDSRTMQLIVAGLLAEDDDFVVIGTAGSARQAEAFFGKGRIDVVTLDNEMPGVGGLDYLRTLGKRAVPAVMLAGRMGKSDPVRAEALRRGAAACFQKSDATRHAARLRALLKAAAARELPNQRRVRTAA